MTEEGADPLLLVTLALLLLVTLALLLLVLAQRWPLPAEMPLPHTIPKSVAGSPLACAPRWRLTSGHGRLLASPRRLPREKSRST